MNRVAGMILSVGIAVGLGGSLSGAARAREATPKCRVQVIGYRQLKVWADSRTQVEIDAKEACQEHFLMPMRLRLVQVRVIQNGEVVRRYFSSNAHYSPSTGQILLKDVLIPVQDSSVPVRTSLVMSLKTGDVRSPRGPQLSIFEKI